MGARQKVNVGFGLHFLGIAIYKSKHYIIIVVVVVVVY